MTCGFARALALGRRVEQAKARLDIERLRDARGCRGHDANGIARSLETHLVARTKAVSLRQVFRHRYLQIFVILAISFR